MRRKRLITLPLAVLQRGKVKITPRPHQILEAAERLRMGQARRFTLLFAEKFWEDLPPQPALKRDEFSFCVYGDAAGLVDAASGGEQHDHWLGGRPAFGGVDGIGREDAWRQGLCHAGKNLRSAKAKDSGLLKGCYTHDWQHDRFSLGAYSYVATGGLDASRQMTEPVADTLFFAGEHTDITGHWGTVHAAMRSGLRAAEQVLSCAQPS